MPFKMHKITFFPEKKIFKKKCVPTLPKIFRPVTRNTLTFFIWPNRKVATVTLLTHYALSLIDFSFYFDAIKLGRFIVYMKWFQINCISCSEEWFSLSEQHWSSSHHPLMHMHNKNSNIQGRSPNVVYHMELLLKERIHSLEFSESSKKMFQRIFPLKFKSTGEFNT